MNDRHLLVVSAHDRDLLAKLRDDLAEWLDRHPGINLEDVAATLSTGRRQRKWRAAVIAANASEAAAQLRAAEITLAAGEGTVDPRQVTLEELAARWRAGAAVDWTLVFAGRPVRKIRLPPSTFADTRYGEPPAHRDPVRDAAAARACDAQAWLYVPRWEPQDVRAAPLPGSGRTCLVISASHEAGTALAGQLGERGLATIVRVAPFSAELEMTESLDDVTDVVDMRALSDPTADGFDGWEGFERSFFAALRLVRAAARPGHQIAVWAVTAGAEGTRDDERPRRGLAAVKGMAQVAQQESPQLAIHSVDVVTDFDDNDLRAIADEVACGGPPERVALRRGRRLVLRWRPDTPTGSAHRAIDVIVTGGVGAVGLQIAQRLAETGARRLLLISRHATSVAAAEPARSRLAELREQASVDVLDVDVTCRDDVDKVVAWADRQHVRDVTVVHAAGCVDTVRFPFLEATTPPLLREIAAAKVVGAELLLGVLGVRVRHFLGISSVSTVIGGVRFGAYAAANAYLESLCCSLRQEGRDARTLVLDALDFGGGEDIKALRGTALTVGEFRHALALAERATRPVVAICRVDLESSRQRILAERAVLPSPRMPSVGQAPDIAAAVESAVLDVLKLETIPADADLIDYDADSLTLIQILSRLEPVFGVQVPLSDAYSSFTIESITQLLEEAITANDEGPANPDSPSFTPDPFENDEETPFPLSAAQERMWYVTQLEPGSTSYNIGLAWRIPGCTSAHQLRDAVGKILYRHAALRTEFFMENGEPVQRVRPVSTARVLVEDIHSTDTSDMFELARERAKDDIGAAFDFDGPVVPVRIRGLTSPRGSWLLITVHHILVDAWSVTLFDRDLETIFQNGLLPAPATTGYRNYVMWEVAELAPDRIRRLEHWWVERLDGFTRFELPSDRPRPERYGPARQVSLRLDQVATRNLADIAKAHGWTPFTAIATAVAVVFGAWSGKREVSFATNFANRLRPEFEEVAGMFVNALLLRLNLGNGTVGEAAARVHATVLDAMEHGVLPFSRVVRAINPPRYANRLPLFSVMYTFTPHSAGAVGQFAERVELAPLPEAKFDLSINVESYADHIEIVLIYDQDLFYDRTMRLLAQDIQEMIEVLSSAPDLPLGAATSRVGRGDFT